MGYSYLTLFVLVCAAIMAATPPSTAQPDVPDIDDINNQPLVNITVNLEGDIGCDLRGPPVANTTVELMCLIASGGLGVAGAVTTQPGGRISGSAVFNALQIHTYLFSKVAFFTDQRILMRACMLVAQAEACGGSPPGNTPSTLMMAPITASRRSGNPTTYNISPRGPLKPPPKLYA